MPRRRIPNYRADVYAPESSRDMPIASVHFVAYGDDHAELEARSVHSQYPQAALVIYDGKRRVCEIPPGDAGA